MSARVLHLADLHLDSAYGGRPATRSALRRATLEALDRAFAFAVDEGLDAVVVAGDAFDDAGLGHECRTRLRTGVAALARAGVHFVYATGNHDPGGPGAEARRLGLERLGSAARERVHVALDGRAQRFVLPRDGRDALEVSAVGHEHARVTDDLSARLRGWTRDDLPRLAVLHTQVGAARGADDHAPYAPSSRDSLARVGAHYLALGHVHVRGRVDPGLQAWYPGNLQGRSARESGPKGGLLVELDADGVLQDPRFVPFAGIEHRTVDLGFADEEARGADDVLHAAARALHVLPEPIHAPALVLRARVSGRLAPSLERDLADRSARAALEDTVRDELTAAGAAGELLEVELGLGSRALPASEDALLDALLASPSAAREALELARAIELGAEAADGLALDGSLPASTDAGERRRRIAELAPGLQAEVLRRISGADGAEPGR
ncbi:MAG: metallophosphoesterase [Planctomycetota bacterium]